MAKPPSRPAKAKKDPAKPTRAKAARPDLPPIEPALAELLNPGIGRGTAGVGSQTGLDPARKDTPLPDPPPQVGREQKDAPPPTRLQPPADNSRERRSDFAAAHTARKSA
ncbi:MAG: hypothetical protein WAJ91_03825, partial [Rhodoplanes sp.]